VHRLEIVFPLFIRNMIDLINIHRTIVLRLGPREIGPFTSMLKLLVARQLRPDEVNITARYVAMNWDTDDHFGGGFLDALAGALASDEGSPGKCAPEFAAALFARVLKMPARDADRDLRARVFHLYGSLQFRNIDLQSWARTIKESTLGSSEPTFPDLAEYECPT
jgi:hypothetical protein